MIRKRIPKDEEGFDLMLQNMNAKCEAYKDVLNISAAQLATLATDAVSYHDWRLVKNQFAETKVSFTEFVELLYNGDKNAPVPAIPTVSIGSPTLPTKLGIEPRTKEFIEYLEVQENFTDAMGLNLGFYENVPDPVAPGDRTAKITAQDLINYAIKILFSKQGLGGLRLSWRIKGTTTWTHETLTDSPYILQIPPDPNGQAITIELQAVLIEKNKPVGNPTDIKTVIAHA